MLYPCPHCSAQLEFGPQDAGQIVQCPYCHQQMIGPQSQGMTLPQQQTHFPTSYDVGFTAPPPAPYFQPPAPYQPQTIHVHTGSRPQKRLGAMGWFTRAFAVTSGYILAYVVFALLFGFLICGGIAAMLMNQP